MLGSLLNVLKGKVKVALLCSTLCDQWTIESLEFSRKNTGVGSLSLLQGIFPTQGSKPRSPVLLVDSLPAEPRGKCLNQLIFPTVI